MAARFQPLIDKLEELKDYVEKLKDIEGLAEKVKRIIDEIDELVDLLNNNDPDELRAFRLLRMFLEKMKDFDPDVPLLSDFLELYIAALRTAESLCDRILNEYDWLDARIYDFYRRAREAKQKQLEEGLSEDEKNKRRREIDEQAHEAGMDGIGHDMYDRYGDRFRDKYDTGRKKEEIERERKRAEEEDKAILGGTFYLPQGGVTEPLPPTGFNPLPLPKPPFNPWFGLWAGLGKMLEGMTPEEREEFLKRLRELFPPVR